MKFIIKSAAWVAHSCKGNPVLALLVVFMFYLIFTLFEYTFEVLVWGDNFVHWLDLVFIACFAAFSVICVWQCAAFNVWRRREDENK